MTPGGGHISGGFDLGTGAGRFSFTSAKLVGGYPMTGVGPKARVSRGLGLVETAEGAKITRPTLMRKGSRSTAQGAVRAAVHTAPEPGCGLFVRCPASTDLAWVIRQWFTPVTGVPA